MEQFTPWSAVLGGVLIGASAFVLLLVAGRVAGISGIVAGLVTRSYDRGWRVSFVLGLLAAGFVAVQTMPSRFAASDWLSGAQLVVAGLLVGFGTRLGGGCTSGHGVCGIGRGSGRSIVATLVFVACGMLTVTTLRQVFGVFGG